MSRICRFNSLLPIVFSAFLLVACEPPQEAPGPDSGREQLGAHENYKDFGEYVVHVNALTTDQLPAEVAKNYGIVRSGTRALLNVVVLKKVEGLEDQPVSADIGVSTSNLTGQSKTMRMRKITEEKAIYYIGETGISSRETLVFDIDAVPEGTTRTLAVRFRKEFLAGN